MFGSGKQSIQSAIASALVVAIASVPAGVAGATPTPPAASRYASIVIDAETGNVLYERNADLVRYPASLTKIMTLYLAFEALASKKFSLNDQLPVSAYAAERDPSRLDLTPGTKLRLEDAIRAITTKSANDAACVIAEALGKGSEKRFAEMMNSKARALGLAHTTFLNASGLPEDGHVTSARDLAMLCRALILKYPEYYRYFATDEFDFHGARFQNQNRFLHTYYGADGIKTGFVNASGHNLAASAVRGGKRLIAIVLGGDTQAWTREHATRLLDVAYAKIDPSLVMVASNATDATTEAVEAAAPVILASVTAAPAAVKEDAPAAAAPAPLPLPNATANLTAYVSGTSSKGPAGSTGTGPTTSPAATVAASSTVAAPSHSPAAASGAARSADPSTHSAPASAMVRSSVPAAAASPATAAPVPTAAPAPPIPPANPAEHGRNPGATSQNSHPGNEDVQQAAVASGDWSVQLGLFRDATIARRRGEEARQQMPLALRGADLVVGRAVDGVHITSRLSRLTEQDARAACNELQRGRVPCVVVPPGRPIIVATN